MNFYFNSDSGQVTLDDGTKIGLDQPEAFSIVSKAWLRAGWDTKFVYSFSWLGRPVIQLPEDLIRVQESLFDLKPDVVVETGVAHGGSAIFYASLCALMGTGRVIGIDVEIRPHNRDAILSHPLSRLITLIEGDSASEEVLRRVSSLINQDEKVCVILDSNHSRDHVLAELLAFADVVSSGSLMIVCDGITKELAGAPRSRNDWSWNNPISAIEAFLLARTDFEPFSPEIPFNEGAVVETPTYWPRGYLRKL